MPDNSITVVGNITRDPELRFTTGGRAVASFGIAVNRRYQVNNEWQEQTSFFDVVAWAQLGENAASSLTKAFRRWTEPQIPMQTRRNRRCLLRSLGNEDDIFVPFCRLFALPSPGASDPHIARRPFRARHRPHQEVENEQVGDEDVLLRLHRIGRQPRQTEQGGGCRIDLLVEVFEQDVALGSGERLQDRQRQTSRASGCRSARPGGCRPSRRACRRT
jgi:hypothetical protein